MKNNFTILTALMLAVTAIFFFSSFKQAKSAAGKSKLMQLTSVESLVGGGAARSRLIASNAEGNIQEQELGHFFSLVGIKFDNIRSNDITIAAKLEDYINDGWELISSNSSFATRPSSTGGDNGILITRYVLKKSTE
jgi:hypothetical protein